MKQHVSWGDKRPTLKGLGPQARQAARAAARRSGMSMADWLDSIVLDAADDYEDDDWQEAPGSSENELRERLAGLAERLDRLTQQAGATAIPADRLGRSDVQAILDRIDAAMRDRDNYSRRGGGDALADQLADISRKLDHRGSGSGRDIDQRLNEITDLMRAGPQGDNVNALRRDLAEIGRAIGELAPRRSMESIEAALRDVAMRVDAVRTHRPDFSGLEAALAELRDSMRAMRPNDRSDQMMGELAALSRKLDTLQRHEPEVTRESIAGLSRDIQALGQRMERVGSVAPSGQPMILGDIEQKLERIEERLSGAGGELERAMRELGERLDQMESQPPSVQGIDRLEDQIRQLAGRFEATDSRLAQYGTLEQSLSELFGQLEATREAARRMQDHAGAGGGDPGMLVSELREIQDLADRRSQVTLNAIQETLERVVSMVEGVDSRLKQPQTRPVAPAAPAMAPTRPLPPEPQLEAAEDRPQRQRPTAPAQRAPHIRLDPPRPGAPVAHTERPAAPVVAPRPPRAPEPAMERPRQEPQFERKAAPPMAEPRALPPIDDSLPDDHPLEPGMGVRPRQRTSPAAQRVAASRAVMPPADAPVSAASEGATRADFIAAARRAALAASQQAEAERKENAKAGSKRDLLGAARRAAQSAVESAKAATARSKKESAAAPEPELLLDDEVETATATGGMRGLLAKRKRPILMGIAALLILWGTLKLADDFLSVPETPVATQSRIAPSPNRAASAVPADAKTDTSAKPDAAPAPTPAQDPAVISAPPAAGEEKPPGPQSALPRNVTPGANMVGLPAGQGIQALPGDNGPAITGSIPFVQQSVEEGTLPSQIGSKTLRSAALAGKAEAEYEVGARFAEGRGVTQNFSEAAKWFQKSADQGVVPAIYRLGSLYEKGQGVKKDTQEARRLYTLAADRGNAKAMHNLAVLFAEGVEGKPDYRNAEHWFRKAADRGISDSQYNLGILHARGLNGQQNLAESYKWFALAAQQGDQDAGKKREDVGKRLDKETLMAAKLAVQTWSAQPQPPSAVQVEAPAGGWDQPEAAEAPAKGKNKNRTKH